MGRPRKLDALTTNISGRIRSEQDFWLRHIADQRFEGELSRTLRWAIDQAQVLDVILQDPDPVESLDRMLNPEKYDPPHPEEEVVQAERELEAWKREQAIKRAQKKTSPRAIEQTPARRRRSGTS
jgi:hypothetical protein